MRLAAQRRLYELTRGRSREIEGVVRRVGWRGLVRGSKSRSPSKDRASRIIFFSFYLETKDHKYN